MRKRRRVHLLTLHPDIVRNIVRWSAGSCDEQWGFLIGRRSRRAPPTCKLVSGATVEDVDERTPTSIRVDGGSAFTTEEQLREAGGDIPIGAWHSHPRAADYTKQGAFTVVRRIGGVVCRFEAWLRRGRRVIPVEMRVRR